MSLMRIKRSRWSTPTSPTQHKMDGFLDHQPTGPVDDCCATDQCVNACTDEECMKIMDEYCQTCMDHQACQVPGCTVQCEECCGDTTCTDGQCSTAHTQVSYAY